MAKKLKDNVARGQITSLKADLTKLIIDITSPPIPMVGCKCDALVYDSVSKKWYSDEAKTILSTDDSTTFQNLINSAVTSTWLKIPRNICIDSPISLKQGIHITGNTSHGYGWDFNETMFVTNAESLTKFFYFNSDGITNSWHHGTISYIKLFGDDKVALGFDIPSTGECSEIHNIAATGFTVACGKLSGELSPGTLKNVSFNNSLYGLLLENCRHTLNLDGVSGDGNTNLIRFKDCQNSLSVELKGIKSERNTIPIVFENCNGGTFTFIAGSYYPATGETNCCMNILSFKSNRQRINLIGVNPSTYTNLLKDDSSGGKTIVNNNGQNGIISYNSNIYSLGAQDGSIVGESNISLRKYDGTFVSIISVDSSGNVFVKSNTGSAGLSFQDNDSNIHLRVGKSVSGIKITEFLRGICKKPLTITTNCDIAGTENTLLVDATSGNIAVTNNYSTMPTGFEIFIKKVDSTANTVTISGTNKTFEGASSIVLSTQWSSVKLMYDGTQWLKV